MYCVIRSGVCNVLNTVSLLTCSLRAFNFNTVQYHYGIASVEILNLNSSLKHFPERSSRVRLDKGQAKTDRIIHSGLLHSLNS